MESSREAVGDFSVTVSLAQLRRATADGRPDRTSHRASMQHRIVENGEDSARKDVPAPNLGGVPIGAAVAMSFASVIALGLAGLTRAMIATLGKQLRRFRDQHGRKYADPREVSASVSAMP
jgi:hypothetical protein